MIAAICSAMTKPAPITAATIWATNRVRLRADRPEQQDGDGDRDRGGGEADGDHDAIDREPAQAAAEHQNVDERRCEQHRHAR